MKKLILRTGLITVGSLSILTNPIKVYAENPYMDYSVEIDEKEELYGEELIIRLANVYEINEDIIVDKMKELTGNYESMPWKVSCEINGNKYSSKKEAIVSTVRDIYHNPANYNLTYEDLKSDYEYEPTKSFEDLIWDYSNIIGVNKEVALSISYAECGPALDSYNFTTRNNPAGLGPHNTYLNMEQGVIEYLFVLKNYGCTIDSNNSLFSSMASRYCTDGTDHWIGMTNGHYYTVTGNGYYYYADMYGREHYSDDEIEQIKQKEKILGY